MVTAPSSRLLQPASAWVAILSLIILSVLGLFVAGGLLRYAFPAGCFLVGAFLFFRHPLLYVGFTWWIWFLAPFVRRLIDYRVGWLDPNPVLLAPFLVTSLCLLTMSRQLTQAIRGSGLPFVLSMMSVLYGLFIGLMTIPSRSSVIVAFLSWFAPIVFGYHLFSNWRRFPAYRQLTQKVFLWGIALMAGYGILQFLIAPPWDRFWLQNVIEVTRNHAFGVPVPLGMRVFGTLQSHQPFACFMVAGTLLLLSIQHPFKLAASGAGYLALLLTMARAAWLSWLVGIVVFLPSLKPRLQIRLIITLILVMLIILPLMAVEPFSGLIADRFQSFFSVSQDGSYIDRSIGYSTLLSEALQQFEGKGIGFVISHSNIGGNDSGILTLLFNLGWIGTIPYLGGLLLLLGNMLRDRSVAVDPFSSACRAIALATFAQMGLNSVILSGFGMVLWGFIGLSTAAHVYYTQQQLMQERQSIAFHIPFPPSPGMSGEER